jgi:hypothetical protein
VIVRQIAVKTNRDDGNRMDAPRIEMKTLNEERRHKSDFAATQLLRQKIGERLRLFDKDGEETLRLCLNGVAVEKDGIGLIFSIHIG